MASAKARELNKHLVVLHVLSPGDYRAHDRADKRIDFVLRNLRDMQADFDTLNIPMHVPTMEPRKSIPGKVIDWLGEIGATHLFGNIEYEVDELRRDIEVYEKASDRGVEVVLVQDICIVQPGKVLTKVRFHSALQSALLMDTSHSKASPTLYSRPGSRTGPASSLALSANTSTPTIDLKPTTPQLDKTRVRSREKSVCRLF